MTIQPAAKVEHEIKPKHSTQTVGLHPDPSGLVRFGGKIKVSALKQLARSSVLSADLFDHEMLFELCKLAAYLQTENIALDDPLDNKILLAAFFEPSTRTRLSFENAMLRLGGKILSIADGSSTSISKGESLVDVGQMFNSYADVVVVRHMEQQIIQDLSLHLNIPIINGGNGQDEHPTQALADWFALMKWRPELGGPPLPDDERIHIGIIGRPGMMRTVKSFLILALLFKSNVRKITVISEMVDPLGEDVQEFCDASPVPIEFTNEMDDVIGEFDVVYINSTAFTGEGYVSMSANYELNEKTKLKDGAVIMHPLPREEGKEISEDLDDTDHNLYFNQADGAVTVRKALLLCIFDRLGSLPDSIVEK